MPWLAQGSTVTDVPLQDTPRHHAWGAWSSLLAGSHLWRCVTVRAGECQPEPAGFRGFSAGAGLARTRKRPPKGPLSCVFLVDLLGQLSNPSDQVNQGIPSLGERCTPVIASSSGEHGHRPRRLTQGQVNALVEAYRLGATVMDLAVEHGIHRTTVTAHLQRSGISRRSDIMRWSPEQLAEITELYSQGSSVRTIGAQYGVDPSTVAKRMKRAGVKLRPRRGFA